MLENANDLPGKLKQEYAEIYAEIRKITNGTKSLNELKGKGVRYHPSRESRSLWGLQLLPSVAVT